MIRVETATKSYGKRRALDGVSFEVAAGEIFGLLGPNGAGKTTLMKLLSGLLRPDAGRLSIAGRPGPHRPSVRKALGFAPQNVALYGSLSAEENLWFFGKMYQMPRAALRQRVQWALETVELTSRRKDRVDAFSGGMKRRLNLACALLHDPPVLLLDEPMVAVDPHSRAHLQEAIEQLHQQGRTVLLATHHMGEAEQLCDRVAIVDHGKILALGSVRELIEAHGGASRIQAESKDGQRFRLEAEDAWAALQKLSSEHGPPASVHVQRPSLESVFLNLTGRNLRD